MDLGEFIPSIQFKATSHIAADLQEYHGQWLVLYFYPKDATPGCTKEGLAFSELYPDFKERSCVVFGISRDSLASHEKFKAKQGFAFDLISDENEMICQLFDVIKLKNMYGKKMLSIERSTFIINPRGEVAHAWRKVKVNDHANEVLLKLKTLQA